MLSRLATRSVNAQARCLDLAVRTSATEVVETGVRDEKNFPRPVRLPKPPVRMGFIPGEWFTFFHNKTGVTGPYLFGAGLINYLVSKEYYVLEHEYYNGLSIALMFWYITVTYGPEVAAFLNKGMDEHETQWNQGRVNELENLKDSIAAAEKAQWQADGQETLIEVKKENVLLQLEAVYRERLMLTYQAVKQRLDYNLEKQNIERRISQKEMIDWILDNVRKAITPDQEKATINQCIGDLAALASRSK